MISNLSLRALATQSVDKIMFWLNASRVFALPVTVIAWAVAFTLGAINGGNIYFGVLALAGLCLAHLGTNLFDDYMDYEKLVKTDFAHAQACKCEFIRNGSATHAQTLMVVGLYFGVASAIGAALAWVSGWQVLIFALAGTISGLFYSKSTYVGLGEVFVLVTYGPALFGGVYFVMTKTLSPEVFLISIPVALMIVGLLHTHTLLDYDFDKDENKKTLTFLLGSTQKSIIALSVMFCFSYLIVGRIGGWLFLSYLTLPFAILHIKKLLRLDSRNDELIFMQTLLTARNLAVGFSILVCLGLVLNS